jgi:transcriptional regulator with XRE-family HTH domain
LQVELIKAVKQKENMTNRQIAEKTGLSESTVSRILSRQVEPKFEDVVLIAVAVGVSLDALAGIARDESEEVKELRALLAEKDAQLATYERIVSSYDKLLMEKDGGNAYLKKIIRVLAISLGVVIMFVLCFDTFALMST